MAAWLTTRDTRAARADARAALRRRAAASTAASPQPAAMVMMKQLFLDGALEGKGGVATISR